MKIRTLLSALAATSGLLLAALPGQASAFAIPNHHVTQSQIDTVQTGQSSNDVIGALGQPEDTASWMDGTHSLVYQTYDNAEGNKRVYVDLDSSGKVTDVEVLTP
jgi:outer membrane protein assembly factor BamE (lipoprotein component of BamABCDE complex)